MAGRGSRLRPHTLSVPKPLVPVAGKPIVHRLVSDIAAIVDEPIEEVAFVIGDPAFFGEDVVEQLNDLAKSLGAKCSIFRQNQPLGTGHAIMCAKDALSGPAVVAYADTLIRANFKIDKNADAAIWVKQVEQPEAYGVVQLNEEGHIVELVEKPPEFVSDLAVIGIYYFKEIAQLKEELQAVLDQNLTHGGEYQINDGIKRMFQKGKIFVTGEVSEWMDCGNKQITVETNKKMLDFLQEEDCEELLAENIQNINSTIIPPCFIADGVHLINAKIGPYVSIGPHTIVENAAVSNSIIQSKSVVKNADLNDAMIGNNVHFDGSFTKISIGDYSELKA